MSNKSSLSYLPPNLRTSATPIYPHVADVFDKALELTFYKEINKLKSLYDPASEYFDTSYVLDLLGENTLKNLLSDVTDSVSLTMIVSDIQNIKGTKAAFEAILKLIKIDYKNIIYTKLANGCTEVTLIMNSGIRVDLNTISDLIRFSQEVFPLCLSLSGVTNCVTYDASMSYSGYNELEFGVHTLDRTFVLDMSKLDTTYGKTVTTSSGSLNVLICNPTFADASITTGLASDVALTTNIVANFIYSLSPFPRLDRDLILDRQNATQFYGSSTYISTVKNFEMTYLDLGSPFFPNRMNVTQFRLDRDPLDRHFYHRLDGVRAYVHKNGLDRGITLDRSKLDADYRPIIDRYVNLYVREQQNDQIIEPFPASFQYAIKLFNDAPSQVITDSSVLVARDHYVAASLLDNISITAGRVIRKPVVVPTTITSQSKVQAFVGAQLYLDYSKPVSSMYLPALTI